MQLVEESIFSLTDVSIVIANILYNMVAEMPLPQLDFWLSLVARLLNGHQRPAERRDIAPTAVLPMRLSEHGYPEPVPKDTPYGEHLAYDVDVMDFNLARINQTILYIMSA